MEDLYKRILQMGLDRGYKNMTEICVKSGVKRATMTEFKNGRTLRLSIETLQKFAALYQTTVDEILYGTKKDLPLGLSSKPVEFDVDRLTANYDDGLTDSQRDLISLIYELPDDVVLMLLSAAKEWLKNHKSADSAE